MISVQKRPYRILRIVQALCLTVGVLLAVGAQAQQGRDYTDARTRVEVCFDLNAHSFPDAWTKAPISLQATTVGDDQIPLLHQVVDAALSHYPAPFLKRWLHRIQFVQTVQLYGTPWGGFNDSLDLRVYLSTQGGDTAYLQDSLHHELSHVLEDCNSRRFPTRAWMDCNAPDAKYGIGGVEALQNSKYGSQLAEADLLKGFVSQYAASDIEEDFACTVEYLFSGKPAFWSAVDKYPRIKAKVALAIAFYHSLDKSFTEAFFRQIKPVTPQPLPQAPIPVSPESRQAPNRVFADARTGVEIRCDLNDLSFPAEWRQGPVNVRATALADSQIATAHAMAVAALSKYPPDFLKASLKRIQFTLTLSLYGAECGSEADPPTRSLYLAYDTGNQDFIERNIHCGLAQILHSLHTRPFPEQDWIRCNASDAKYGNSSDAARRAGKDITALDEKFAKKGFVCPWATLDIETDFAVTMEYLFSGKPEFWALVDKYPRLKSKIALAIGYYHAYDDSFTEEFFRNLKNR